jgi:hypothetical protein
MRVRRGKLALRASRPLGQAERGGMTLDLLERQARSGAHRQWRARRRLRSRLGRLAASPWPGSARRSSGTRPWRRRPAAWQGALRATPLHRPARPPVDQRRRAPARPAVARRGRAVRASSRRAGFGGLARNADPEALRRCPARSTTSMAGDSVGGEPRHSERMRTGDAGLPQERDPSSKR